MANQNNFYKYGFFVSVGIILFLIYSYKQKTDKVKNTIKNSLTSIGLTTDKAEQLTEKILNLFD